MALVMYSKLLFKRLSILSTFQITEPALWDQCPPISCGLIFSSEKILLSPGLYTDWATDCLTALRHLSCSCLCQVNPQSSWNDRGKQKIKVKIENSKCIIGEKPDTFRKQVSGPEGKARALVLRGLGYWVQFH